MLPWVLAVASSDYWCLGDIPANVQWNLWLVDRNEGRNLVTSSLSLRSYLKVSDYSKKCFRMVGFMGEYTQGSVLTRWRTSWILWNLGDTNHVHIAIHMDGTLIRTR